jgi:rhodanese-related sulfurtransferase
MKRISWTFLLLLFFTLPAFATAAPSPTPVVNEKLASVKFITVDEYSAHPEITLIDVRSIKSRQRSNLGVHGAVWIDPHSEIALKEFVSSADKNKTYSIFCSCPDDGFSINAWQILTQSGFSNVSVLKDGWDAINKKGIKTIQLKIGGDNQ